MSVASLNITGLDRLALYFDDISDLDWRPMLDDIGVKVIDQTQQRITEEKTSPDGVQWVKHSAKYEKSRHKNQSMLNASGNLLGAFEYQISGDTLVVGNNLEYAATHQYGRDFYSYANPGNAFYPARPYLGVSEENGRDIVDLVNDYITDILKGAG